MTVKKNMPPGIKVRIYRAAKIAAALAEGGMRFTFPPYAGLPLFYFWFSCYALAQIHIPIKCIYGPSLILRAVVPALGIFGLYRLWLGIVEIWPNYFYANTIDELDERYHHTEPTFLTTCHPPGMSTPFVYLGQDTGFPNIIVALLHIFIPGGLAWLPI